ncbi:NAD(P)-binding protein [Pholiota conissans]|uniref:3-oxoacyl-[acyl-carrier-protein] reductase n=1 Tax=Pholiota conissans TaxID=109636 RepID=A0A9P5YQC0_9AGAR|nr:NAD(P)-binding protein [Pholiota conissans]
MTTSRTALVTGASRGIGKAIALRLANDGYSVALNDVPVQLSHLTEVKDEIMKSGHKAIVCVADVSKEDQVERMVKDVVSQLGSLDVMVANAGVCQAKPMIETTTADFQRILDVNAIGTYLCYKYAAKQMIEQGKGGRIIGASSMAGKQAWPNLSLYCASKFAIRGLTQASALEFGKHGITVNAYAPGVVDTEMIRDLRVDITDLQDKDQEEDKAQGMEIKTEEIAGLVAYLVSKEAGSITGQCVSINKGMYFD